LTRPFPHLGSSCPGGSPTRSVRPRKSSGREDSRRHFPTYRPDPEGRHHSAAVGTVSLSEVTAQTFDLQTGRRGSTARSSLSSSRLTRCTLRARRVPATRSGPPRRSCYTRATPRYALSRPARPDLPLRNVDGCTKLGGNYTKDVPQRGPSGWTSMGCRTFAHPPDPRMDEPNDFGFTVRVIRSRRRGSRRPVRTFAAEAAPWAATVKRILSAPRPVRSTPAHAERRRPEYGQLCRDWAPRCPRLPARGVRRSRRATLTGS
jgi:hypothetical protein